MTVVEVVLAAGVDVAAVLEVVIPVVVVVAVVAAVFAAVVYIVVVPVAVAVVFVILMIISCPSRLLVIGYKKQLDGSKLYPLRPDGRSQNTVGNFYKAWREASTIRWVNQQTSRPPASSAARIFIYVVTAPQHTRQFFRI